MSQTPFEMLEQFVMDLMQQMKIPGMSVGILMNNKEVYAEGYGARNLEKNLSMTPNTLFGIGSISKSFAALAIMQLYEENKLDIQNPVNKYVNFKLGKKEQPIRIHHLLSHTTGFPELWAGHSVTFRLTGGISELPPMSSWKDFFTYINGANSEKIWNPGEKHSYNNDTFAILAPIVEKVSKMSYPKYVKDKILIPLQMNRTTYSKEDFESDQDAITGYLSLDGELVPNPLPINILGYASGALTSSVREMENYAIALMNEGNFNGTRIIQKSSIEKMWTSYGKVENDMHTSEEVGYGYGWRIEKNFFGHTLISHGGDYHVCGGDIAMIPEKKMGVIVGLNKQPGPIAEMISRGILAVMLGKDINSAVPLLKEMEKFQLITGNYRSYKNILKGELLFQGGLLMMKAELPKMLGGTMTLPLIPKKIDELEFAVPILGAEMPVKVIHLDPKSKKVSILVDRYLLHKI